MTCFQLMIKNRQETCQLALKLAQHVKEPGLIFFQGDLGAGKTTFVASMIAALGYEGSVTSPTYTLVENYPLSTCDIYHMDLYRLDHPEALEWVGARDFFHPKSLCLVEWPERAESWLPKPDVLIAMYLKPKEERTIMVSSHSEKGHKWLHPLHEKSWLVP